MDIREEGIFSIEQDLTQSVAEYVYVCGVQFLPSIITCGIWYTE